MHLQCNLIDVWMTSRSACVCAFDTVIRQTVHRSKKKQTNWQTNCKCNLGNWINLLALVCSQFDTNRDAVVCLERTYEQTNKKINSNQYRQQCRRCNCIRAFNKMCSTPMPMWWSKMRYTLNRVINRLFLMRFNMTETERENTMYYVWSEVIPAFQKTTGKILIEISSCVEMAWKILSKRRS